MNVLVDVEGEDEYIVYFTIYSNHVERDLTPPKSNQTCVYATIER